MLLILILLIFRKTICIELVEQEEQSVKDEQFYFQQKKSKSQKERIEALMKYEIPVLDFPEEVELTKQLTEEERPKEDQEISKNRVSEEYIPGPAFPRKE